MSTAIPLTLFLMLPGLAGAEPLPVVLEPGVHLFVDDFLIEKSVNLTRTINTPSRALDRPGITGPEDKNWQPYLT